MAGSSEVPHPIQHPSMTKLFTEVLPALRAGGIDEPTIEQFLVHNPRRFLAGVRARTARAARGAVLARQA